MVVYVPLILINFLAYFQPEKKEQDHYIADCNNDYKMFLLVCDIFMVPFMLFMLFMICIKCIRCCHYLSIQRFNKLSYVALSLEAVICNALFVYWIILSFNDICDDTGTYIGAITVEIMTLSSFIGFFVGFILILIWFDFYACQIIYVKILYFFRF